MSGFVEKIKSKVHSDKSSEDNQEQQFTIQPHPATTNDPADLQRNGAGAGLRSDPAMGAHHAKGPHILSDEQKNSLETPKSREELKARSNVLNQTA